MGISTLKFVSSKSTEGGLKAYEILYWFVNTNLSQWPTPDVRPRDHGVFLLALAHAVEAIGIAKEVVVMDVMRAHTSGAVQLFLVFPGDIAYVSG